MKVTFLGQCANQTDTHDPVSFIVDCGSNVVLVETGPGIVRQILRAGRFCTDIAHVVVTHCHGDHTLGFPYFVWNHFYEGLEGRCGPDSIHVYGLPSVLHGLKNMLEFCYITSKYPFAVEYHPMLEDGPNELQIDGIGLSATLVDHTTPNMGLRIDYEGRSLAYSSDTIYSPDFRDLAANVDLMIHEGFVTEDNFDLSRKVKHGTSADAGRCAREAVAKQLALVHLFPPMLGKIPALVAEAEKDFTGKVFVPDDFETVVL